LAFKLPTCNSTHTNLLLYSSHLRRADVSRNGDGQVIDYFLLNSSNQITRQRCRFPVGCCNARECPDHCARCPKRGPTFSSPHPFAQIELYSCRACRSVPPAARPFRGTRGTAALCRALF